MYVSVSKHLSTLIIKFITTASSGVTGLSTLGNDGERFIVVWNLPQSPNGVIRSYRIIVKNLVDGNNITNNTSGFNFTYTGLGMSFI